MDPILSKTVLADSNSNPAIVPEASKESTSEVILLSKKTSSAIKGIESLLEIDENENLIVRKSVGEINVKCSDDELSLQIASKISSLQSGIPIPIKRISNSSVDKKKIRHEIIEIQPEKQNPPIIEQEVKASESSHSRNIFDESESDYDEDENEEPVKEITIEEIKEILDIEEVQEIPEIEEVQDTQDIQEVEFSPTPEKEFEVFEIFEPVNDYISQYASPRPENSSCYIHLSQLAGIFPCPNFIEDTSSKWDEKLENLVQTLKEWGENNPDDLYTDNDRTRIVSKEQYFVTHLALNSGSKVRLMQKAYLEGHLSRPKRFTNSEVQTVPNRLSRLTQRGPTKPGEKVLTPNVTKMVKKPPVEKKSPKEKEIVKKSPPQLIGSPSWIHSPEAKSPRERKKTAVAEEIIDIPNDDKTTSGFQSVGYRSKHMKTKEVTKKPGMKPISSPKNVNLTYGGRVMPL